MDPASSGGEGRRTPDRRVRQRQYDRADAQKNILKPHLTRQWVIAPEASAAFVANMEDVLEVYQRPHDPRRPLVCLDETSKQLIIETRKPIAAKPGQAARHDYEYERNGVANLFMMFAPLEGWRHVKVTDRRTAVDYAMRSKICPTRIFPTPTRSFWFRTTSTRTRRRRSTKPSPPPKRAASSNGSNGITRPSTEAGSTWPNPNSPSSRPSASIAASPTSRTDRGSRRLGATPQHPSRQGQLAIHNRRRPRQARKAVPSVRVTRATKFPPTAQVVGGLRREAASQCERVRKRGPNCS